MTTPDPTRLNQAAALVGTNRPQLAYSLASSSLDDTELATVGGFVNAMHLATVNQLARDSGAQTNYTDAEGNALSAVGEQVKPKEADSRSWLEQAVDGFAKGVTNAGNFLFHNPVTGAIEKVGNFVSNVAHMPFRLLSSALDLGNDDEIDREMRADGYDPHSTKSYLAFMFNQGENQYHDLGKIRDTYGDDLVDQIVQMQRDPEGFWKDLEAKDPNAAEKLNKLTQTKDFQDAFAAVDQRHISPGRDLARVITFGHTNNTFFKVVSGTIDAAYDWYSDPTLILGKANRAIQAMDALGRVGEDASAFTRGANSVVGAVPWLANKRRGLQVLPGDNMIDMDGVRHLLRVDDNGQAVTKVGRAWQGFLNDAQDFVAAAERAKTATSDAAKTQAMAEQAGIFRAMNNRYGPMMPLLDEVTGARQVIEMNPERAVDSLTTNSTFGGTITGEGSRIQTLPELAEYLTQTNGLLRLHSGFAALRTPVMPGRLSLWAERRAAVETHAAKASARRVKWLDYTGTNLVPNEGEQPFLDAMASLGRQQHALTAHSALGKALTLQFGDAARIARAKADRISRRFTTLIPTVTHIDLNDSGSAKLIEQVARVYLNKGESARLASAYQLGDLATRRQIAKGVLTQSFHASGIARTEEGQKWMEQFLGEVDGARQQYALNGESLVNRNGQMVEAALYPNQLSTKIFIPSMREMTHKAAKFAVSGFARRTGLASFHSLATGNFADAVLGTIKMGWITTIAGGLRNALDEVANFAATGLGRQYLQGRVAFTQATKELRAARRADSLRYREMLAGAGGNRDALNLKLSQSVGKNVETHEEAQRALEQAQAGQLQLDNAPGLWDARHNELLDQADSLQQKLRTQTAQHKALLESMGPNPAVAEKSLRDSRDALESQIEDTRNALARKQKVIADRERLQNVRDSEFYKPTPDEARAAVQAQLDAKGVLTVDKAERQLAESKEELRKAQNLEAAIKYRVPLILRGAADHINDVLIGSALGKLMSFRKSWAIDPEMVKVAQELVNNEWGQVLREGVFQSHFNDSAKLMASDDYAMDLHRAGIAARKYAYVRPYEGYGEVETDGGAGLDAWAKYLQLRFNDDLSPAHAWVQAVKSYTQPGEVIDQTALAAAKAAVRDHLDKDELRHFVNQAEVFKQTRAGDSTLDNPALLAQAKDEYADRVSADLLQGLAHQGEAGPVIQPELLDRLAKSGTDGLVPDRTWLAINTTPDVRPAKTIGQLWGPYNRAHPPGSFPRGYTQMLTKAYDKVVTDQINALSRNPLMTALYYNARKNTLPYRNALVEKWGPGSEEAADAVVQRIALQHAQDEAFKHIDNPYVASQFSLIGRNYFAFVRAQEDWLRRWGRTLRDNPQIIREAQLAIHGAESMGLVEQDDTGNLMFVYPGSRLMLGVLNKVIPGAASVPMNGELTSQVMFLNPSLDNPIGLSATPLLSIPFKALTSLMGNDHALLKSSLDQAVNGQLGAGRAWYEQMLPSWANRIISGLVRDDPASKYGQAYMQALANMEAAGQIDDQQLQTAQGKADFQHKLAVSIRNNLAFTALFGLALPAAPTLDPQASGGRDLGPGHGSAPDWSAHLIGLHSLKDEANKLIADVGYEKALALWQKLHPGELVYVEGGSKTEVTTAKATAPATVVAARYMEQNTDFFGTGANGYGGRGGVAAYFLPSSPPQGSTDGQYSDVAYRAQLEMGIRDYKSLDQFFEDIVTQRGADAYFKAKDQYDAQRASLVAAGARAAVAQLDDEWAAAKQDLMAGNPLLAKKFSEYATDNALTGQAIEQLTRMAKDTSRSTLKALGANREGLLALLQAREEYQAGVDQLGDSRSNHAIRLKNDLKTTYTDTVQRLAGGPNALFPELADLARGVFRLPD
jgi:hypothetical protein